MARIILSLVLAYMGAIMLNLENPGPTKVEAYEIGFSDDVTTDLAKGSIDVPSLIRQDWLKLPVVGSCGLASKFTTAHIYNTAVQGTFYTTFEYLTQDCTAESRRDNNSCALLTAAFAVCMTFPLDRRSCNHLWGYCSNYNFRVSYLWVPYLQNATNVTMPMPKSLNSPLHFEVSDPAALATIHQDVQSLRDANSKAAAWGGRQDTKCDWRFSNLVPVAWDGIQNVLTVGQSLQTPDLKYTFIMQQDCNLVLYRKGFDGKWEFIAKWATYSHYNDPFPHNCTTELQSNGNLVVKDPAGNPRWASNATSSTLYTSVLALHQNGTAAVYEMNSGAVLWTTG